MLSRVAPICFAVNTLMTSLRTMTFGVAWTTGSTKSIFFFVHAMRSADVAQHVETPPAS